MELSIKMPVTLATRDRLSRCGPSFLSFGAIEEGLPLQAIRMQSWAAGAIFMPHGVKLSKAGKNDVTKQRDEEKQS